MKTTIYCIMLLAIACIYTIVGYSYAAGMVEPEVRTVEVEKIVTIDVPFREAFSHTKVYAVMTNGDVIENPSDFSKCMYKVTVEYNPDSAMTTAEFNLPIYDDTILAGYISFTRPVFGSKYRVSVESVIEPDIKNLELGDKEEDGEGDEF